MSEFACFCSLWPTAEQESAKASPSSHLCMWCTRNRTTAPFKSGVVSAILILPCVFLLLLAILLSPPQSSPLSPWYLPRLPRTRIP
ncbi:hypothetical protein OBBRIDRAFT_888930 [Obba rivulosa]|uniref:Uncharacterized protein n=1 Tax=Obba rivulosa TaxID=1052685 RepID=A0A8E2DMY8_9APHY|nr:hypothetical protein OBBRIDRAFT_888930 [Obba rivulosa]